MAAWLDPGPATIVAPSSDRAYGFDFALLISSCLAPSGSRRGRQGDREWITAQHHEGDQPPGRPLAVRVGPNQLSDVAVRLTAKGKPRKRNPAPGEPVVLRLSRAGVRLAYLLNQA
jgi:hypothetical protein